MAAGLAVALARDGMPFRKAHGLVGSLVAEAQRTGETLSAVGGPGRCLTQAPAVAARVPRSSTRKRRCRAKAAPGGTAPERCGRRWSPPSPGSTKPREPATPAGLLA